MEQDSTIGVAQAKILLMNKRDTFDCAGVFINAIGFGIRGLNEKDRDQYDHLDEISYAKGAAMIVRQSVWNKLKGFDSLFFTYFEETDFCWRVWLSGYRVVFVPSAKVFHVGEATITKYGRSRFKFQNYRNGIVMVVKNLSFKNLAKYLPWLVIVYSNRIRLHIRDRDYLSVLANVHGMYWCLRFFKIIWTKRLSVQQLRTVSDSDLFKRRILSRTISL